MTLTGASASGKAAACTRRSRKQEHEPSSSSSPARTTVLELAKLIWQKIHGADKPFRYVSDPAYEYDVQERSPNTDKAASVLGFRATTPLSDGLDEIIPWIAEQIEIGRI